MRNMMDGARLLERAREASAAARCPYSGLAVGAAVLGSDGSVHTGCNVENAAYGSSMCAERVALFKAVSEGCVKIAAVAVYSSSGSAMPCGACRQVISELAPDAELHVQGRGPLAVRDLLPHPFGSGSLPGP